MRAGRVGSTVTGVEMKYSEEELEHVHTVLTRKIGAAWSRVARVEFITSVRRVKLDERTSSGRHAVIWEGPPQLTSHLEGVDLDVPHRISRQRAVCLDAMSESLQRKVSATMERWARESGGYPIVSVQLTGERVAVVSLRGSRKRILVGMRSERLLVIYEPRAVATGALTAALAGAGVAASFVAAHQPALGAATAGLAVALGVLMADALRPSRPLSNPGA